MFLLRNVYGPVRMRQSSVIPAAGTQLFSSSEDAWFWTMTCLRARHEGVRSAGAAARRPCDPDDVLRCLDRLYRSRRISLGHARVLRTWGTRQRAPGPREASAAETLLWREALAALEAPLRQKGILV